jgi:hypothetical protein
MTQAKLYHIEVTLRELYGRGLPQGARAVQLELSQVLMPRVVTFSLALVYGTERPAPPLLGFRRAATADRRVPATVLAELQPDYGLRL